jgi:hypothetical protein
MTNPNAVHGRVDGLASEPERGPDDFDFEEWLQNGTLPMELGPAREVWLKRWFEAHGFTPVRIRYRPKVDRFRVVMRPGHAGCCCRCDDEAEDWLRRAAVACGAEPEQVIGLLTTNGKVLGSFKLPLPQPTWLGPTLLSQA